MVSGTCSGSSKKPSKYRKYGTGKIVGVCSVCRGEFLIKGDKTVRDHAPVRTVGRP